MIESYYHIIISWFIKNLFSFYFIKNEKKHWNLEPKLSLKINYSNYLTLKNKNKKQGSEKCLDTTYLVIRTMYNNFVPLFLIFWSLYDPSIDYIVNSLCFYPFSIYFLLLSLRWFKNIHILVVYIPCWTIFNQAAKRLSSLPNYVHLTKPS